MSIELAFTYARPAPSQAGPLPHFLSPSRGANKQPGNAALSMPPPDVEATERALQQAPGHPSGRGRLRLASLRHAVEREDLVCYGRQIEDLLEVAYSA